jgi:D-sedoheptulose 7-phosphate isomerase
MTGQAFIDDYLDALGTVIQEVDIDAIQRFASELSSLRQRRGRLFLIGVGGSAANCSHAVNDFRKLCAIDAYAPTDNVAEITARTNDNGWESVFVDWLRVSDLTNYDAIMVFSVGGGTIRSSNNISKAVLFAKEKAARVLGIVGGLGGETAKVADVVIKIDPDEGYRTPFVETMQAVIWHCLVNHPLLKRA